MTAGEIFARAVKRLREQLGMTQAKLAESTGLSVQMVAALEQQDRGPTLSTIDKLCRVFGVAPSGLFAAGETVKKDDSRAEQLTRLVRGMSAKEQDEVIAIVKAVRRIAQGQTKSKR
jgi:transcriptional regulator with XRE-family HTH domain